MGILLLGIRPICQIKHHSIGAQMGCRPARNINTMVPCDATQGWSHKGPRVTEPGGCLGSNLLSP